MILTEAQARFYLNMAGFKGSKLDQAVMICNCESGYDTNAHNTTGEDSRGLMQINVNAHPQYANLDLFDPNINVIVAREVYLNSGSSFNPCTCAHLLGIIPGEVDPKTILVALAIVAGIVLYYK